MLFKIINILGKPKQLNADTYLSKVILYHETVNPTTLKGYDFILEVPVTHSKDSPVVIGSSFNLKIDEVVLLLKKAKI